MNPHIPDDLQQEDQPIRGLGPEDSGDIWQPPLTRYAAALAGLPDSGGGGCHAALLRVANYGRIAGLDAERIFQDLRARVRGARRVSDKEIREAIAKSFASLSIVRRAKRNFDGPAAFARICERGRDWDEARLAEVSPVVIDWPPEQDTVEILQRLYSPGDKLFIGEKFDSDRQHICSADEWVRRFRRGARVPPHIIPNPISGRQGYTQDGKRSYRADACVAKFKYVVCEFDGVPFDTQLQFFGGLNAPVVALIHSGSKSVHAWLKAGDDVTNAEEWTRHIEIELFDLLRPMGVDGSCRNEARLSRLPGHYRLEKKKWQRLLFLNPAGAPLLPWGSK